MAASPAIAFAIATSRCSPRTFVLFSTRYRDRSAASRNALRFGPPAALTSSEAFIPEEYWNIAVGLRGRTAQTVLARLSRVDGEKVAEVGPGALLGERALLEGGQRTSTLTAITKAKVAVVDASDVEPHVLAELAEGHKREEA